MARAVNRSQGMVLAFFSALWLAFSCVLFFAPDVYLGTLKPAPNLRLPSEIGLLSLITALLAMLGIGVVRRWRLVFWLIVVAFLPGVLRVPASFLELTGVLPTVAPAWYTVLQAVAGLSQFAIAVALLRGYRKSGAWGAF